MKTRRFKKYELKRSMNYSLNLYAIMILLLLATFIVNSCSQ